MKLKAEFSEQGENFLGEASVPLCPPTTSQRLKYSILSFMSSWWGLLPLINMPLFNRSMRIHTLSNSIARLGTVSPLPMISIWCWQTGGEQEGEKAADPCQGVAHKLDVNQRTWLLNFSHYPYSLQVTIGPCNFQVALPKPEDLIVNWTWSHAHQLFCPKEVQRVTGAKAVRVSGPEMLTQGTILIEYHKVFLLLLRLGYEDLSLTCEPPSVAASLPQGRMSTDW